MNQIALSPTAKLQNRIANTLEDAWFQGGQHVIEHEGKRISVERRESAIHLMPYATAGMHTPRVETQDEAADAALEMLLGELT